MRPELTHSGISVVGDVPWGLHFSLFYQTSSDLLDAIVPYFEAGLAANDFCVWAPTEPSLEDAALEALRARVPDVDRRIRDGDLLFFKYDDFRSGDGPIEIPRALARYRELEETARDKGYSGLRASGNLSWVDRSHWAKNQEYEEKLHEFVLARRMVILCSYPLASAPASNVLEVARTHHFVIARRDGMWEVLETPALKRTKDELQRLSEELEKRVEQRTADLRRSERYLEQGQELSHTGSAAWDPISKECTFWSAENYRIFGLQPRARPPTREEVLTLIHPADRDYVARTGLDMIHGSVRGELECRIVRPSGETRYIHAVSSPVLDDAGELVEVIVSVLDVTDRRRAAAKLARVKRAERERTLEHRFAATLEERTRLAREIHDSLLQGVTGIALQLRATLPHLGSAPEKTTQSIRDIVELAETTIRDARRAVWDMRAAALLQKGLLVALEEEVRQTAHGLRLNYTIEGTARPLPAAYEDTIFRIGQEAVTNAVRHSGARTVSVTLAYERRHVRLTVADDGRGFHVDPDGRTHGGRWGLLGMRERAERIGASLVFRSSEGKGTTVELSVPIRQSRNSGKPPRRELRAS